MRIMNLMMDANGGKNFSFTSSNPRNGHLFVRFKSNAVVLTKSGYVDAKPGDYVFYHKRETTSYSSYQEDAFVHDFFRFDITDEEFKDYNLPTATLLSVPFSEKEEALLKMLAQTYFTPSQRQAEALHLTGLLFLASISEHLAQFSLNVQQDAKHPMLLDIRFEIYHHPQQPWTVEIMAKRAMVSTSYFQHIYKETFGISPINDVIQARITMAENLLLFSNKKAEEIAALCGYSNVEHFVRQFRKCKGITPSRLRDESKGAVSK